MIIWVSTWIWIFWWNGYKLRFVAVINCLPWKCARELPPHYSWSLHQSWKQRQIVGGRLPAIHRMRSGNSPNQKYSEHLLRHEWHRQLPCSHIGTNSTTITEYLEGSWSNTGTFTWGCQPYTRRKYNDTHWCWRRNEGWIEVNDSAWLKED